MRRSLSYNHITYLAAAVTIIFWASAFVGIRATIDAYSAGSLALLRYLISSVLMAVLFYTQNQKPTKLEGKDWFYILILGLLGFSIYNVALNSGERTVPAGIASFIISLIPVFMTVLAYFFLKEPVSKRGWLGVAVSICGILVIAIAQQVGFALDLGVLLVCISALSAAAFHVMQKPMLRRFSVVELNTYAIWAGTAAMLVYTPQLLHDVSSASFNSTMWVFYLGIFPGAIAYMSWSFVLSRVPASIAASYIFTLPLVATCMGVLMLHERPNVLSLVGGVIALLGAILVNFRKRSLEMKHSPE